ncbi:protein trichome birefringence-like 19 [Coffea arabica]|uniref:Protein trichome birefringence-like 19 n=1 Tax=Coffea arabica TaxID=13443 RepID=A0A6P6T7Y0_COFAR|nr:protein trichome birefringence-like 19 [Coffea arabica]
MKFRAIEHSLRKHQTRRKIPKIASVVALTILLSVISIYSPSTQFHTKRASKLPSEFDSAEETVKPTAPSGALLEACRNEHDGSEPCNHRETEVEDQKVTKADEEEPPRLKGEDEVEVTKSAEIEARGSQEEEYCDLFSGEWVPNPEAPYYTNSCYGIQEHQNCMKYGRPDIEFLKWRWKPDGCELPIFDPRQFLQLVRGKSIAFVGDSVARNHLQSLMCLLSSVLYPREISNSTDENRHWEYQGYNFRMSIFWAPYLVRSVERTGSKDRTRSFSLYLDEFDENWTTKIEEYDYFIISAGHWFFRPTMFYEKGNLVGCQYCPQENVTRLTAYFSYQRALRTAFRAINSLQNFKSVIFLRTFAPSHFENGTWDSGGNCPRTRPYKRNEAVLEGYNLELYKIELEELRIAQEEGRRKPGLRFRLFDATKAMLLRPDGHPSVYGHLAGQNLELPRDCVHWCLPGPIDSWNDFLLELLRRELPN